MIKGTFYIFIFFVVIYSCQVQPVQNKHGLEINLSTPPDSVSLFAEGIVSTGYNERDMAISADGDEIFYSLGNYTQKLRAIVHLCKKDNNWVAAEILPWSGRHNDIEPFLSPDGSSIFFASDRPVNGDSTRKDFNIWVSKRNVESWEEPVPLDSIINTKVDEFYPSLGKSGNLYFTAARPGNHGKEDIYMSQRENEKYLTPAPLDSNVNSATYEFNAFISPEEDTIIFSSYGREDDFGGGDLYVSTKDNSGNWQPAKNLGPKINSSSLDYCPFIDFPRKSFYFTSNRASKSAGRIDKISIFKAEADKTLNGLDNIYFIKLSAL
jgi:hypothetical protein